VSINKLGNECKKEDIEMDSRIGKRYQEKNANRMIAVTQ